MDRNRKELFENPTAEYRAKPFWSWNGRLEEEELLHQIDIMKEMGFGGYFMHSRTGLETEYLGEDWFRFTRDCAEYGERNQMESWLYDEDRWPSGSAGGIVTKEEKFRASFLEMKLVDGSEPCEGGEEDWKEQGARQIAAIYAIRFADEKNHWYRSARRLSGAEACLESDGKEAAGQCLEAEGKAAELRLEAESPGVKLLRKASEEGGKLLEEGERLVIFYTHYAKCDDNYNGYTYLDTMNREGMDRYIEVTHEQYKKECGDQLGASIRGIFTDEPHRGPVFSNFSGGSVQSVPFTPALFQEFERRFGYDLRDSLKDLFFRKTGEPVSKPARDYLELCQELFLENYAMPYYDWCEKNHMKFTGHVLHEDSLTTQTVMQGSLMRFYEYMHVPGVDVLSEGNRCYWIVKQIASAARQLGKKWLLSELYGCTGWQMNFESYKNVGDWQALFGINLRCPHLSWYTMKGEAKRDYPASILHQSAWYPEYKYVENYFSRMNTALEDGDRICSVLFLNPIESVWARSYSGAFDGLSALDEGIQKLETQYVEVFDALIRNQIDFDYGEEDILARHGRVESGTLWVGNAAYRKVLVAGTDTLRSSTLALLTKFAENGGEVVFAGEAPGYVDALPSGAPAELAAKTKRIAFEKCAIAEAMRTGEEVLIESDGAGEIFVQAFRQEGENTVMLLNTNREQGFSGVKVTFPADFGTFAEQWDAASGGVFRPDYSVEDGHIVLTTDLAAGEERLYKFPIEDRNAKPRGNAELIPLKSTQTEFRYALSEPNICVLDKAEVVVDGADKLEKAEVLKADRALRSKLGIPFRGGEMLQPWFEVKQGAKSHRLCEISVTYSFEAEWLPGRMELVVEDLSGLSSVAVNGVPIQKESCGKWIDICFDRIFLPMDRLMLGRNTITLTFDYFRTSGIEAAYLLGDFGVRLDGARASLVPLPETIHIGDITGQGLPFYSGTLTYRIEDEELKGKKLRIKADQFEGALVKLIGRENSIIAWPPYTAGVEDLAGIQVVLTRRNTFGPLHALPARAGSYGPGNFLTEGEGWTEEYVLLEQGLVGECCFWQEK